MKPAHLTTGVAKKESGRETETGTDPLAALEPGGGTLNALSRTKVGDGVALESRSPARKAPSRLDVPRGERGKVIWAAEGASRGPERFQVADLGWGGSSSGKLLSVMKWDKPGK